MKDFKELSPELRAALERWAEETLSGIGLFRDDSDKYKEYEAQVITQLRSAYSDRTIDVFLRTTDKRKIKSPDGFAKVTGDCGDTMEIFFSADNGMITDASFQTDGCKPTIASGGMVVEMIRGRSIDEIKKFTQNDVLNNLDGLPEDHHHCAMLAIYTLKEAIENYQNGK